MSKKSRDKKRQAENARIEPTPESAPRVDKDKAQAVKADACSEKAQPRG